MATDGDLERLRHDVEALAIAVRALQNLEAPMQSKIVREFSELQADVKKINEEGALATRGQLDRIRDRIQVLEDDVRGAEETLKTKADQSVVQTLIEDRKSLTRLVLAAVIAAILSLVVQLIAKAVGA